MAAALQEFAPGIWIAGGPQVIAGGGFHYPTRMAVIRLSNGGLFVWSPVALTQEIRTSASALGDVQFLIAPNSLHDSFLTEWQAAYPASKLYAPPGLRQRRKDLVFEGELDDAPPAAWSADIDQVLVRGNAITLEGVFFHRASGTAIFTDLIQHFEPGWFTGWRSLVARLDLMTAADPEVPRKFRVAFRDRTAARAAVRKILGWPIKRVLMAHGPAVATGGHALVERAFKWLKL